MLPQAESVLGDGFSPASGGSGPLQPSVVQGLAGWRICPLSASEHDPQPLTDWSKTQRPPQHWEASGDHSTFFFISAL